jgi:imidazoleglycerol-phosphate dehydratase
MFSFQPVSKTRTSHESRITVCLEGGERKPTLKEEIRTPIHFLNHMIEQWAWRACINPHVSVDLTGFRLDHVICEDSGICLGGCLGEVVEQIHDRDSANGSGVAYGIIDEATARVGLSFEYRVGFFLRRGGIGVPDKAEDAASADLIAFLGGIAQGARATLQIDLLAAEDPHHLWEAVFRGLGEATRVALSPCPWRKGARPGVAGKISTE